MIYIQCFPNFSVLQYFVVTAAANREAMKLRNFFSKTEHNLGIGIR